MLFDADPFKQCCGAGGTKNNGDLSLNYVFNTYTVLTAVSLEDVIVRMNKNEILPLLVWEVVGKT